MKHLWREALIHWHGWLMVLADVRSQKYATKRDRHAIRAARLKSQRGNG